MKAVELTLVSTVRSPIARTKGVSPGATTSGLTERGAHGGGPPKLLADTWISPSRRSTAPTAKAFSSRSALSAGSATVSSPAVLFPAANTTGTPANSSASIALWKTPSQPPERIPHELFRTSGTSVTVAGSPSGSRTHCIPCSSTDRRVYEKPPNSSKPLTATHSAPGATPVT